MNSPDAWRIPESAFQAFESLTRLTITVHELSDPLWPYLHPARFRHRAPCCLAVKASRDWACIDFEVTRLRKDLLNHPDGRLQQCHAGIIEWVLPVFIRGRLTWIFFAGQAHPDQPFQDLVHDIRETEPADRTGLVRLSQLNPEAILEAMRQLRSRLLHWHQEMHPYGKTGLSKGHDNVSRSHKIRAFIADHHSSDPALRELAEHLGLSRSRTSHVVKNLFGVGFKQLLNLERFKTAASLLRNTDLPILEVCYTSGFQDVSHFHRMFLKNFKQTPLQYRKTSRT